MQGKYKIITLCGSTRFKAEYERVQKELTLKGNIIISVGLFGHQGDDEVWEDGTKEMLDDMYLSKIDMADEIFVINPGGYIGQSTSREIAYAKSHGKKISSIEPIPEDAYAKSEAVTLVLDRKTSDYIRSVAEETGETRESVIKYVIEDYERISKNQ